MNILRKLNMSSILTSYVHNYCLVCERVLKDDVEAINHEGEEEHVQNLDKSIYDVGGLPMITATKAGFFCCLCNIILKSESQLYRHVLSAEQTHLDKHFWDISERNGKIYAHDDIVISDDAWSCFVDNICYSCNVQFLDKNRHAEEQSHIVAVIQTKCLFGREFGYKIFKHQFYCLHCGNIYPLNKIKGHQYTTTHKDSFELSQLFRLMPITHALAPVMEAKIELMAEIRNLAHKKSNLLEILKCEEDMPNCSNEDIQENVEENETIEDIDKMQESDQCSNIDFENETTQVKCIDLAKKNVSDDILDMGTKIVLIPVISSDTSEEQNTSSAFSNENRDSDIRTSSARNLDDYTKLILRRNLDKLRNIFPGENLDTYIKLTPKIIHIYIVNKSNENIATKENKIKIIGALKRKDRPRKNYIRPIPYISTFNVTKLFDPYEEELSIKTALRIPTYVFFDNNGDGRGWCVICDQRVWNFESHVQGLHHINCIESHKERLMDIVGQNVARMQPNCSLDFPEDDIWKNKVMRKKGKKPVCGNIRFSIKEDYVDSELSSDDEDEQSKILEDIELYEENDININFSKQMAECLRCSKQLRFHSDILKIHIKSHKKIDARLDLQNRRHLDTISLPWHESPSIKLTDEAAAAECIVCDESIEPTESVIADHIHSNEHRAHLISEETSHGNNFKRVVLRDYLNTISHVEPFLRRDVILNEKRVLSSNSFLMISENEYGTRCCACDIAVTDIFEHVMNENHKYFQCESCVVSTLANEFIREIRPNTFHCGDCNIVLPSWEDVQTHIKTPSHDEAKTTNSWNFERYKPYLKQNVIVNNNPNSEMRSILEFLLEFNHSH